MTPARRYLAVDGGNGAHLLAALAGCDPRLQPTASARHADVLLVVEPVNDRLLPALLTLARAIPGPAQALLVGEAAPGSTVARYLRGARPVRGGAAEICRQALAPGPPLAVADGPALPAAAPPVPPEERRELATEPTVLSLGPVQPFTAGPLRVLLVCDGEQVCSAEVEADYAGRNVAGAMMGSSWRQAAALAARLDPLAPLAGGVAYVRCLERLQGVRPGVAAARWREAALALERVENHLWWLARLAGALAQAPLAARARSLALAVTELAGGLWPQPAGEWLLPGGGQAAAEGPRAALPGLAREVERLLAAVRAGPFLPLRTRGVGTLQAADLRQAGVTGPVLAASLCGGGDAWARLLARLEAAARDLERVARLVDGSDAPGGGSGEWQAPAGEARASALGPRGRLGLHLVGEGGPGPAAVAWRRPSALLLPLLPAALAGQTLADAEVTLASLDLAMAEADG